MDRCGKFETLKSNGLFHKAYHKGKSRSDPALVTYVLKNRAGFCSVGITASRKLGCAVTRNRARRVIREAFRSVEPRVRGGRVIVFVARSATAGQKSTRIAEIMLRQLSELGSILPAADADDAV